MTGEPPLLDVINVPFAVVGSTTISEELLAIIVPFANCGDPCSILSPGSKSVLLSTKRKIAFAVFCMASPKSFVLGAITVIWVLVAD